MMTEPSMDSVSLWISILSMELDIRCTNEYGIHVAICVLYALSVFAMQQLVKSFGDNWKPPTWMNTVKLTHNIALSLVSGWMFVVMVKETYQAGN